MSIEVDQVSKRFATFTALEGLSLAIPDGQLVALLGPSGSGKTTLLRLIAGLDRPDAGMIRLGGMDTRDTPLERRRVGFVFQHYALFRHMTISDNVAFGLQARPRRERPSAAAISAKVRELLELVQLANFAQRYPHQLSGGQRQRVALARALAVEPRVLLLDEPFGALDARVRADLRRWLRDLHRQSGVTTVLVTHDQEEAMEVADRVVVINHGRIEQDGSPQEVYDQPRTPFVFDFIGQAVRLPARVDRGVARVAGLEILAPEHAQVYDHQALVYARPHHLLISTGGGQALPAVVRRIHALGALARIELEAPEVHPGFEVHLPADTLHRLQLSVGQAVGVAPRQATVFLTS